MPDKWTLSIKKKKKKKKEKTGTREQGIISCLSHTYLGSTFLSVDISQRSREDSASEGSSGIYAGKTGHRTNYFSASEMF